MATRENRRETGRRKGELVVRRLASEIKVARQNAGLSQQSVADLAGWTQTEVSRFERDHFTSASIPRVCQLAAVVGLDFSAGLHAAGDPIRDRGHEAAIARFLANVGKPYRFAREVPRRNAGDRRAWDLLLRLVGHRVGVEVETRIRDIQALVRRIRERERDGGVDVILIVLSDTIHNRALVAHFREALGQRFAASARSLLVALRTGVPLPGSGVVLV